MTFSSHFCFFSRQSQNVGQIASDHCISLVLRQKGICLYPGNSRQFIAERLPLRRLLTGRLPKGHSQVIQLFTKFQHGVYLPKAGGQAELCNHSSNIQLRLHQTIRRYLVIPAAEFRRALVGGDLRLVQQPFAIFIEIGDIRQNRFSVHSADS